MERNVIVFGLISGVIVSVWMICGVVMCYKNGDFEGNMVLGYVSMILALAFVFIGVKNYRDKYNGGIISFGKAFMLGLYISLVASTMYVLTWLVAYYGFIPDFMDKYAEHVMNLAHKHGDSAAEIAAKTKEINMMRALYKTPAGVVAMTYLEILPVGLIVTLITAAILKRKPNNDSMVAVG